MACILGATLAGWPSTPAGSSPVVRFLLATPSRPFLALTVALFIAVNLYIRTRRGFLDGDEHHSIARAQAFGYFKNFLVSAVQLDGREGAQLQVFRPRSMEDLRAYASRIEPRIRERFEHE